MDLKQCSRSDRCRVEKRTKDTAKFTCETHNGLADPINLRDSFPDRLNKSQMASHSQTDSPLKIPWSLKTAIKDEHGEGFIKHTVGNTFTVKEGFQIMAKVGFLQKFPRLSGTAGNKLHNTMFV